MSAGALSPGSPSTTRKTATPASATMMSIAARRAVPEKSRSPRRTTGFPVASVDESTRHPSAGRDRADDLLRLRGDRRVERGGAGLLRRSLLTRVRDDVGEEAADQVRLVGVVVVLAGDQVRRQQHRVGTRLG